MEEPWQYLRQQGLAFVEQILGALGIVVLGGLAIRYLVGPFRRLLGRTRLDPSVSSFLANSTRMVLVAVVAVAALNRLGVPTASLLTLLGAAGLAIALSLQNSLGNFASGLLVLAFRMVRVGDLIEVGDARGRVLELRPFHVVLVTLDNQVILLPNTLLTSGPVRNNTTMPTRRVQWNVPLQPTDDLEAVKSALREQLQADPRILPDPAPQIYVQEWTADHRTLTVAAWCASSEYVSVQQEAIEELGKRAAALRAARP